MQQSGSGWVVYGDDVEAVAFDWGVAKFLSEPAVTGAERFSFGMVVLAPGKGHERHNHPGSEEIIYVLSGEGQQMVVASERRHGRLSTVAIKYVAAGESTPGTITIPTGNAGSRGWCRARRPGR